MTAHITNHDRELCFTAGMDDYLGKPFKVADLERVLARWLTDLATLREPGKVERTQPIEQSIHKVPDDLRKQIHDLRNALAGVMGGIELALLAQKKTDTEMLNRQLNNALNGAQRAVDISSHLNS